LAPFAVGAYITGAYWFTSSTSFANPAVAFGRMFSNTFAGIAPASVPAFVVCQMAGAACAVGLFAYFYPRAPSAEALVEHEEVGPQVAA
jgi:arsenate reductase